MNKCRTKSYLAIVDRRGLQSLFEEQDHTYEFLMRRISRPECLPSIVVWSLLNDEFLLPLSELLNVGNTRDAWLLLQAVSLDIGTLHPAKHRRMLA